MFDERLCLRKKFSLRTGEHLITKGVLSQSGEHVLKKFPGGFSPTPLLLASSLISSACIKVPYEYEQPISVQSVQKNLVGPKHADTPPPKIKFECATLPEQDNSLAVDSSTNLSSFIHEIGANCDRKQTVLSKFEEASTFRVKADFHSMEFSERAEIRLFAGEIFALKLNR